MNIEDIIFSKDEAIERLLVTWGYAICAALKSTNDPKTLMAIRSVATEFSVLASVYSESVDGFREDLGVSLGEAIDFKIEAISSNTSSKEWEHYVEDSESILGELQKSSIS